jgi:hypothetical protein
MKPSRLLALVWFGVCLASCGTDDSGLGRTNTGSGTGTLFVRATVDYESEDNVTRLAVDVGKGGQDLSGARVRITSDLGSLDLDSDGEGKYRARQFGWSGAGYVLEVVVVDANGKKTDELWGSLTAPVRVEITSPDLTRPIDARMLPNDALVLAWKGPPSDRAEIRTKEFQPQPFSPDPLSVVIPASMFRESVQKLEVERQSSVALAGGLPGSTLTAQYRLKTSVIVQNPY